MGRLKCDGDVHGVASPYDGRGVSREQVLLALAHGCLGVHDKDFEK
jgi:hypothetical protein